MGFFSKVFTWWNGATVGTTLFTRLHGEEVGKDDAGNVYFRGKKNPATRWVIYSGDNDGSRVPPDWQAWLKGTIDDLPQKSLPAARKFEKAPVHNLTGTMEAFRPDGSLAKAMVRPASTGDYEAWKPE